MAKRAQVAGGGDNSSSVDQQPLRLIRGGDNPERPASDDFCGHLSNLSLPSLLHIVEMDAKSCTLRIDNGGEIGFLHCRDGRLVHALTDSGHHGVDAAYRIVTWEQTAVDISPLSSPDSATPVLDLPLEHVVLEAMRTKDEAQRAAGTSQLDGDDDIFAGAIAPPLSDSAPSSEITETFQMTIQDSLQAIMSLNGAVGACLVDSSSGMMLGEIGNGSGFNLEIAAAANTEVVRSKRAAIDALGLGEQIEDILISLETQYHLIRPVGKDASLFFYLVLLRDKSNLAMARHKLATVEKELEVS